MAAVSESLNPQIKIYIDGYFAQNRMALDPFIEWIRVAGEIHTKFNAPSLAQKNLASDYFDTKVLEIRKKQEKAQEAWFNNKPLK